MHALLTHTRITAAVLFVLTLGGCSKEAKEARAFKRGEEDLAAGKYEAAKIDYMNVLRLNGGNGAAIARLGSIWYEEGAPLRALPFLLKASKLDPGNREGRA